MSTILSAKDANATMLASQDVVNNKPEIKSLEHHRQVLQNKIEQGEYVPRRQW
jgi:hypothetical protein